jgi:hypothetical protein
MPIKQPPMSTSIVNEIGNTSTQWSLWFDSLFRRLNLSQPTELPSYSVSSLPIASLFEGSIIYVSDESGGKTIAFSDGANWRRVQDRNIVS